MTRPLDDPTAGLFLPAPRGPVVPTRYRSARVLTWDPDTGEHSVSVDGVTLTNLPMHPGPWVAVVDTGDHVSLLTTTDSRGLSTFLIMGIALRPGDPRLALVSESDRMQRIDASGWNAFENTAEFLTLPEISFCRFLPRSAYRVTVTANVYGSTASNWSVMRVRTGGLSGTERHQWAWQMPSLTNVAEARTWVGHLRNATGSTVTTALALTQVAAVNIGVGVFSDSARINAMDVEYVGSSDQSPNARPVS